MDASAKQQITDRVKQANNILVTVSTNPTVDQLAACIGLTLLLNQMDKHATAVFSGKVPSTLEFLQPEKTIETTTDSLRDFIVSLDKNKADKLRYKVEDDVVRIFITPYKTSLSEKDLVFSQGDYNVEVVIALGIKDRNQIDAAITAHGRILHDATVISLNAGAGKAPDIGQINWQDPAASSLCEMVVSISEAFGNGLIDNQMATAFLTGIVAETKRFSNEKTSPRVMTISAQLMAAGANQQLIVSKLEPPPPPMPKQVPKYEPGQPVSAPPKQQPGGELQAELQDDGTLTIKHEKKVKAPTGPSEILIDAQGNLITPNTPSLTPGPKKEEPQPIAPVAPLEPPTPPPAPTPPPVTPPPKPAPKPEPLNPHALLSPDGEPPFISGSAFTANTQPEWSSPYNSVSIDPLSEGQTTPEADHDEPGGVEAARDAVKSAYKPKTDEAQPTNAPAPPFPPPLTPAQTTK